MVADLCAKSSSNAEFVRGTRVVKERTIRKLHRINRGVFFFIVVSDELLFADKRYSLECADLSALWSAATCRSLRSLSANEEDARRQAAAGEKRRQAAAGEKRRQVAAGESGDKSPRVKAATSRRTPK